MKNTLFNRSIKDLKKKLLDNYEQLSEEDFQVKGGNLNRLLSRLQWKLGKSKKEVIELIEEL